MSPPWRNVFASHAWEPLHLTTQSVNFSEAPAAVVPRSISSNRIRSLVFIFLMMIDACNSLFSRRPHLAIDAMQGRGQAFSGAVYTSLYALIKHPCFIQPRKADPQACFLPRPYFHTLVPFTGFMRCYLQQYFSSQFIRNWTASDISGSLATDNTTFTA